MPAVTWDQRAEDLAAADREVDEIMAMSDAEVLALDIEPCPFCAQSVTGPIPGRHDKWDFHCRGCGAIIELSAPTLELAGRNWNTRCAR